MEASWSRSKVHTSTDRSEFEPTDQTLTISTPSIQCQLRWMPESEKRCRHRRKRQMPRARTWSRRGQVLAGESQGPPGQAWSDWKCDRGWGRTRKMQMAKAQFRPTRVYLHGRQVFVFQMRIRFLESWHFHVTKRLLHPRSVHSTSTKRNSSIVRRLRYG